MIFHKFFVFREMFSFIIYCASLFFISSFTILSLDTSPYPEIAIVHISFSNLADSLSLGLNPISRTPRHNYITTEHIFSYMFSWTRKSKRSSNLYRDLSPADGSPLTFDDMHLWQHGVQVMLFVIFVIVCRWFGEDYLKKISIWFFKLFVFL